MMVEAVNKIKVLCEKRFHLTANGKLIQSRLCVCVGMIEKLRGSKSFSTRKRFGLFLNGSHSLKEKRLITVTVTAALA